MKIHKILALFICAAVLFTLCACSGGADNNTNTPSDGTGATPSGSSATENPAADPGSNTGEPADTQEPVAGSEGLSISEGSDECSVAGIGSCADKAVVIPSHVNGKPVTRIDEEAFRDTDITSVEIPGTVVMIDEDAFSGCVSLETVTFGEGVGIIGESAFYGCSSIKSLILPASLTELIDYSFCDCSGLTDVLLLGCTNIHSNAFSRCGSLKYFLMSSSKNEAYQIYNNALQGCESLETLILAPGLTSIGSWNFSDTPTLHAVFLPKSLTVISACAFLRSGIQKVLYEGSEDEWKKIEIKEPDFTPEVVYDSSQPDLTVETG